MKQKNQHEWGFMGNDTKGRGDLAYCPLCNQWVWTDGKPFKMSKEEYLEMVKSGEVYGV